MSTCTQESAESPQTQLTTIRTSKSLFLNVLILIALIVRFTTLTLIRVNVKAVTPVI